jgi:hypothetical protein
VSTCEEPTVADDTNAPVTAEGLRERLTEVITRWALMYPLGNYGIWSTAGASRDQLTKIAEDIAAGWGRDIADRVLAALAGDPGDLPTRMLTKAREAGFVYDRSALIGFDWDDYLKAVVKAVASVRWEHAAHIAARLADAERRAEHAEEGAQLSSERLAEVRTERDALADEMDDMEGVITDLGVVRLQLQEERDALKAARCPSCDHLAEHHQPEGCWYAVTTGAIDLDLVCPCTVPDTALDGGE